MPARPLATWKQRCDGVQFFQCLSGIVKLHVAGRGCGRRREAAVKSHAGGLKTDRWFILITLPLNCGWLGSRVVSVLDSGAEGSGFKSQSRRCRVTVLGKLFTPIVPLFTKQRNW